MFLVWQFCFPTEDPPELSLGKCEDAAVLKSSEKHENAVQEQSVSYEENIVKSRWFFTDWYTFDICC